METGMVRSRTPRVSEEVHHHLDLKFNMILADLLLTPGDLGMSYPIIHFLATLEEDCIG